MMSGSKTPNYDACRLFRALHSHNPRRYSHIGTQGLASSYEQAHADLDLLTLAS